MTDQAPQPQDELPLDLTALPVVREPSQTFEREFLKAMRRNWFEICVAFAIALWGVWASGEIVDLRQHAFLIRKVQLADLMREYVEAEARSGVPAEQMTVQTAAFLKAVNASIAIHVAHGEVVFLSNAVVAGNVTDITPMVRHQVYAQIPYPQAGAPTPPAPDTGATDPSHAIAK